MSTRHRSHYSTPRRSPDDEQFWRNEKEPAHMHAAPVRTGLALHERIGGAWICEPCGGIGACHCDELHTMQVEREKAESAQQVAYLVAQVAMVAK